MSYRITAFGQVNLPDSMTEDDLSTARVPTGLADTLGGAVDVFGARQRLPSRQELSVGGLYLGTVRYLVSAAGNQLVDHLGNPVVVSSGRTYLREQLDALRGMVGKRDQLWRRRDEDGAMQWRTARLLSVETKQDTEHWAAEVAEATATFETAQGTWRGESAVTDTTGLNTNITKGQTVAVLGNAPVEDAVITLTASGTVTSFRVRNTAMGVDWTWTGSLTPGQALVVDCGAMTVRAAGVDAYGGFVLNAGHTAAGWLPLAVGDNSLLLLANAAATCVITHYNQWI